VSGLLAPRLIQPLAFVGVMSYSLYLTHSFVLMHWYWFGFTEWHVRSIALVITVPLSVVFGWLFFLLCERPFMTSHAAKVRAKPEPASVELDSPVQQEQIALAREAA
jgi:peptidoglycan/LPS O-acetylase OafA/YrhL